MTDIKRPKTHVAIILDKSGSMAATKNSAISGFNEQVQQLKEDSKTQDILCSLVTFNGEVYEHLWNVPADQLSEANPDDFQPNGNTAMLDAVGYTVQKLLNTTDHTDVNTAYLIVAISDGDTNMDRHYNPDAYRELVQGCEATKRWTFTYMGCAKEKMMSLARATGTSPSNMAAWSNSTGSSAKLGMSNLKARQKKFFAERAGGQTAAACYASDEAGEVADFTAAVADAAPAPVVVSEKDLSFLAKEVDLASVLSRQPKYTDQASPTWNGGPLFANSLKVEWTAEAAAQVGVSMVSQRLRNVSPMNRPVSTADNS